MSRVVSYISIGLWVAYFLLLIYREIKRNNLKKDNNFLHIIRIDSIFFLVIYALYWHFMRNDVLPYLFSIITLTNLVYLLYDLADNYEFRKVSKKELPYFLIGGIIIIVLTILLVLERSIYFIFLVCLIVNTLVPIYVLILNLINKQKKN